MTSQSVKIELVSLSVNDIENFIKDGKLHCPEFMITQTILPEIVAKDALTRLNKGQDWLWCSPRLFKNSDNGAIVGSACFKNSPYNGFVEIGYGVLESFSGKGFATTGIAVVLDEAFTRAEVKGITGETSVNNIASQRVLEKNGFVKTGTREDAEDGSLIIWKRLK
jgi:RimJ/RimL family protein N-acetyltransferase